MICNGIEDSQVMKNALRSKKKERMGGNWKWTLSIYSMKFNYLKIHKGLSLHPDV